MTIRVHVHDAGRRLTSVDEILSHVETTSERAGALLDLDAVDVVIYENRWGVIPEVGCGGTAPGPHTLLVSIDPGPTFDANWRIELGPTVAHELHHCKRYRSGGSYGTTLREAIASEGLAEHFETAFRVGPPVYAVSLDDQELARAWELALPELDEPTYDHAKWFFGGSDTPRWAAYALGWSKVEEGLRRLRLDAAAAWNVPADELVH